MLLVTGITGHSGGYFLQELIDHKYEGLIRCILREKSDTSKLDSSGLNIEKIYGDLNDLTFLKKAVNGIETIMHIYNIHHSPMILEAAIENNVKRVILVHTTGIYSNFKYASQGYKDVEKKVLEMTSVVNCPTKVTILRPTMIYGDLCDKNMSKFIKLLDKMRFMLVINGGHSLIQPVNARDLGKAYYSVLMSPEKTSGKVYDLSGEKPLKMIDVFKLISNNLNRNIIYISVPLGFGVALSRLVKIITIGKIDYTEKVQRMAEDRSYPHTEATIDFDFNPMSFDQGIQTEVLQYLQSDNKRR